MRAIFSIQQPKVISRCEMLEVWNKFVLAFDEVLEEVSSIGGCERVSVFAVRNDSSHLYRVDCGFPLVIVSSVQNGLGRIVGEGHDAHVWINNKTGQLLVSLTAIGSDEIVGENHELVVTRLSIALLNLLKEGFETT